jgi:hypothetical protein
MGHRTEQGGSGTLAVDEYRDGMGQKAAGCLSAGFGYRCVAGDHLGGELCVETIARLAGKDPTKNAGSDALANSVIQTAVNKLHAGIGVHKVAADHAGGNTCCAVIAAS